jgi:hypothetical protein
MPKKELSTTIPILATLVILPVFRSMKYNSSVPVLMEKRPFSIGDGPEEEPLIHLTANPEFFVMLLLRCKNLRFA